MTENIRMRSTLFLLAAIAIIGAPTAAAQNLTDQWVEKAAGPLVEKRVVAGLSVGYIEGEHYGIVHLGSSSQAKEKANNLTVYEIGSLSKVFTGLLLADAVARGEIDLYAAADVANPAGIRLPSRDGRSINWLDLSTHRAGLPRLPGNLPLTDLVNPYRDYDSKKAAAFLNQYVLLFIFPPPCWFGNVPSSMKSATAAAGMNQNSMVDAVTPAHNSAS